MAAGVTFRTGSWGKRSGTVGPCAVVAAIALSGLPTDTRGSHGAALTSITATVRASGHGVLVVPYDRSLDGRDGRAASAAIRMGGPEPAWALEGP